jgi:P27 family predicted phage terminase small subunit
VKGRPPTPSAIRVLEGVRGHRPLRREPAAFGAPIKPSWVKGPAGALWRSIVPELQRTGVVGAIDTPALVALCECWAQLCAVDAELADPGNRGDAGLQRRSNQLRALLLSYLAAFGLTPASRSRLAPPAPPTDDTMGGLLR